MSNITILLIAVSGGILIGGFIAWTCLKSRLKKVSSESIDKNKADVASDLPRQIAMLEDDLSKKNSEIESLRNNEKKLIQELERKKVDYSRIKDDFEQSHNLSENNSDNEVIQRLNNEVKTKTKLLQSKEQEIEDLEDDLSSVQRKLSSIQQENEEITDSLSKVKRQLEVSESNLKETEFELQEMKDEDALKSEAIDFVNTILNAPNADDNDAIANSVKVQKVEDIINDQYIDYLKKYNITSVSLDETKKIVSRWANLQRKSWIKGKKVVAFIGEFSAGKTSIVNRILSQDDPSCPRLPVSSKATTAIATYISYGSVFMSQFTDANGNLKQIDRESFEKVNKDILNRVAVSPVIRHFVIKYNNDNLRGLSILDTPGFSSNDAEDQDRTLEVVNEADALFWVMDANSGEINRTSLKIISENLDDMPLYVIINKSDTKSPGELDKLEAHIRKTMSGAGIDVSGYLRFSQKADITELMSVISQLPDVHNGLDIVKIFTDMKEIHNSLNENLLFLKRNCLEGEEKLDMSYQSMSEIIEKIQDNSDDILEVPQKKDHWFRASDFRLSEADYQTLCRLCEEVKDEAGELVGAFDEMKSHLVDHFNNLNELDESKQKISGIINLRHQLENAVKLLDVNLYREILDSYLAQ